ncbi:MAG TPA: hypothetical protein VK993_03415 [Chthoniobacterales bacterium]|nr:hypothetical protein [Chthoniobacterales bacterium]
MTLGEGLGDAFFLPPLRAGDGEFAGVADAAGVGEVVGFGELVGFGVALPLGVGDGEPFELGDGVGDLFFFVVAALVLFFFFGVGVGSKMLLILSPNDCACVGGATNPNASASGRSTT